MGQELGVQGEGDAAVDFFDHVADAHELGGGVAVAGVDREGLDEVRAITHEALQALEEDFVGAFARDLELWDGRDGGAF